MSIVFDYDSIAKYKENINGREIDEELETIKAVVKMLNEFSRMHLGIISNDKFETFPPEYKKYWSSIVKYMTANGFHI